MPASDQSSSKQLAVTLAMAMLILPRLAGAEEASRLEHSAVLGPKWSPAMSLPDNGDSPFFSFSGGGSAVIRLGDSFSVQPELLYSIRSWSRQDPTPQITEESFALHSLDIPVHGRVHVYRSGRTRLALLVGAQASVLLFGVNREERSNDDIVASSIPRSDLRTLLPSASAGIAAEFDLSQLLFALEGRFTRSLQRVGHDESSPHLTTVGIMLGVMY